MVRILRPERVRDTIADALTDRTTERVARLPSDLFLWGACGAILGSIGLHAGGRRHTALFVEQLAPMLLILGLYNRIMRARLRD